MHMDCCSQQTCMHGQTEAPPFQVQFFYRRQSVKKRCTWIARNRHARTDTPTQRTKPSGRGAGTAVPYNDGSEAKDIDICDRCKRRPAGRWRRRCGQCNVQGCTKCLRHNADGNHYCQACLEAYEGGEVLFGLVLFTYNLDCCCSGTKRVCSLEVHPLPPHRFLVGFCRFQIIGKLS
jgi:hypothetical protein